jgi:hypothetical protein
MNRAFVCDGRSHIRLGAATRFDSTCERVETFHAVQLVGVAKLRRVERARSTAIDSS